MTIRRLRQVEVVSWSGLRRDVWWIDAHLAIAGKTVRDEDGSIWLIVEVFGEATEIELEYREAARAQFAGEPVPDVYGGWETVCDG